MIQLATMEAESENTVNWLIFWNLLNQVISSVLSRQETFNPIGWCVDEAGSVWKTLKDIYGEDAIKHRPVSCYFYGQYRTSNLLFKKHRNVQPFFSLLYMNRWHRKRQQNSHLKRLSLLLKGNQEKGCSWEDFLNYGIRENIILAECSETAMHQPQTWVKYITHRTLRVTLTNWL